MTPASHFAGARGLGAGGGGAAGPAGAIANLKTLGAAARRLGVPAVLTEQYPKGLGRTLPELRALLGDLAPLEKTAFSCAGAPGFTARLRGLGAERVVLCGMEAHVCVLLTALH